MVLRALEPAFFWEHQNALAREVQLPCQVPALVLPLTDTPTATRFPIPPPPAVPDARASQVPSCIRGVPLLAPSRRPALAHIPRLPSYSHPHAWSHAPSRQSYRPYSVVLRLAGATESHHDFALTSSICVRSGHACQKLQLPGKMHRATHLVRRVSRVIDGDGGR